MDTATEEPTFVQRWVPLVAVLRNYQRGWLIRDAGAAVVLTGLLIPAGMGYAQAAGLPAVTGLYATVVPLLVYAALGPSRTLVYGPDSSLAALIAAAVVPLAAGDARRAVMLAGLLAVLTGLLCVLAAVARFGFLAELLSSPVRAGYMNGIALTIAVRQLPKLLGFSVDADSLLAMVRGVAHGIEDGQTNRWALGVGAGALIAILGLRRLAPRVPATLVAMVAPIAAAGWLELSRRGVPMVGTLPRGLPELHWALLQRSDVLDLSVAAAGIAFVAFADTSVLSRTLSMRHNEIVDPNQELFALGAVNLATGVTGGFSVSSSASRTPVAEAAGARTQLTGVFAAALVAVVMVALPGAVRNLPTSVLAAVVIAAAVGLVEIGAVVRLARIRRSEFVLSMAAFAGVALLGVIGGIALAIVMSLLEVTRRAWRPHAAELVRVDGTKGYHEADRHPEGRRIPGLLLYRFDAPLFFANAGYFAEDVLRRLRADTRQVTITAEPITDIDTTAAETLDELIDELRRRGITLQFAELKGHVRDQLAAYGLVDRIGADQFSRTVGEAVKSYVRRSGVAWQDWEDDPTDGAALPPDP